MTVALYPGAGLTRRSRIAANLPLIVPVVVITDFFTEEPQVKWLLIDPSISWVSALAGLGWGIESVEVLWLAGQPDHQPYSDPAVLVWELITGEPEVWGFGKADQRWVFGDPESMVQT